MKFNNVYLAPGQVAAALEIDEQLQLYDAEGINWLLKQNTLPQNDREQCVLALEAIERTARTMRLLGNS